MSRQIAPLIMVKIVHIIIEFFMVITSQSWGAYYTRELITLPVSQKWQKETGGQCEGQLIALALVGFCSCCFTLTACKRQVSTWPTWRSRHSPGRVVGNDSMHRQRSRDVRMRMFPWTPPWTHTDTFTDNVFADTSTYCCTYLRAFGTQQLIKYQYIYTRYTR